MAKKQYLVLELQLGQDEYLELTTHIEGTIEELEELERNLDYFVSETPDRLRRCLDILDRARECAVELGDEDDE